MEPRFPGIPFQHPHSDHIPPPFHQSPRPGFTCLEFGRFQPECYPPHPHPNYPHPRPFAPPQFNETQESIEREIEKSRIREEIIMGEVMRRRMLESEVRRELMMERELGLRQGTNGFQFGFPSAMGLDSPLRFSVEDERNLLLHADRRLKGSNFEGGLLDDHPFQRGTARVSEVKSISEDGKRKERIILLAKTDEISRSKREAVTTPDADENLPDGVLKKRAKVEWCCALCQVSATSESALKEHLGGRRHKAKEARLKAKGIEKNQMKGALSKKVFRISGSVNPAAEGKLKLVPKSLSSQTDLQDKNHPATLLTPDQSDHPKRKMKFYCEMCKVGADNEKVMEGHKKGKKHIFRQQKLNKNVGTGQSNLQVEDEKVVALDGVDLSNQHDEDEKVVALVEVDQSNQPNKDGNMVASGDATAAELLDSGHVPTDAVEPEKCKTVDEADTKQEIDEPDTKNCEDATAIGSNDKSVVDV